jgi:hypothetical protein
MLGELLGIFASHGWVALILSIVAMFAYKWFSAWLDLWLIRKKAKKENAIKNDTDIKFHPFFANTQYHLMVEIPNLEIMPDMPIRQKVFKDLIYIKMKTMYDICKDFSELNMEEWRKEEWVNNAKIYINKMVVEYELRARQEGIPDIVIQKYKNWSLHEIDLIYEYVGMLGGSALYTNNRERTNTFLLIMNLMLVTTLGDAERTLDELNGELTGKEYKGHKIE